MNLASGFTQVSSVLLETTDSILANVLHTPTNGIIGHSLVFFMEKALHWSILPPITSDQDFITKLYGTRSRLWTVHTAEASVLTDALD